MEEEAYQTNELAFAAYLRATGHESSLIPPPDPTGFCRFAFPGDPAEFQELARQFANGASVSALDYYQALNALRAEIRYVRGGWR